MKNVCERTDDSKKQKQKCLHTAQSQPTMT